MKKMFVLLLVALLGSQMIFAQVRACVTFDKTRNLEEFKQVILTWKDPFIRNELWPAYVAIVNEALKEKGMTIPVNLKGINFILEHTQEYDSSYFVQNDYFNGVRIGDNLDYRNVAGNPSNWSVFVYDDVVRMYSKIGCCNPQKLKFKNENKKVVLPISEKTSPSPLTPTPKSNPVSAQRDTIYIVEREIQQDVSEQPERVERSNVNTYYINNATPYGYYGLGYYYGLYLGRYCYRYYGGPGYHFTGGSNYGRYTGRSNQRTGNNYNFTGGNNYHFTGGNNRSTGNYNFTGGNNRQTNYGGMSTGRGSINTTSTTNHGSTGRGGCSNVSFSPTTSFSSSATTRGGRR